MIKVGLISDSNYPSLPLMKISAFHKSKGDKIKLVDDLSEKFDLLYVSKTFNLNLKKSMIYLNFRLLIKLFLAAAVMQ